MSDETTKVVHKVEVEGLFGVIGYIGLGFLTYALAYGGTMLTGDAWTWATIALWPFFVFYWVIGYLFYAIIAILLVLALAYGASEARDRIGRK